MEERGTLFLFSISQSNSATEATMSHSSYHARPRVRPHFPLWNPNVPFRICILPKQYKEWPENRTAFLSREMGFAVKVIDAVIFLFLLVIALAAPLLDAQTFIPHTYYPGFLVQLKNWYSREYGDYLVIDKPPFFVGLVCFELIFQWPLVLLNLYAILTSKAWFNTTCLIYGVSLSTSMVVILSDMVGSGRASAKLLILYCPFMAFGVLATLRGLLSHSTGTYSSVGKRPAVPLRWLSGSKLRNRICRLLCYQKWWVLEGHLLSYCHCTALSWV